MAFKVITTMEAPDHSTIAEFCLRHAVLLGELFVEVLALCGEAGLVKVGEVAVDGTKGRGNASRDRNRSYEWVVFQIFEQAERIDREEDEPYCDARGDELPKHVRISGASAVRPRDLSAAHSRSRRPRRRNGPP